MVASKGIFGRVHVVLPFLAEPLFSFDNTIIKVRIETSSQDIVVVSVVATFAFQRHIVAIEFIACTYGIYIVCHFGGRHPFQPRTDLIDMTELVCNGPYSFAQRLGGICQFIHAAFIPAGSPAIGKQSFFGDTGKHMVFGSAIVLVQSHEFMLQPYNIIIVTYQFS